MAGNVVPIPTEYRRPREMDGGEIWASPKPSDLMVWEVCPSIRPQLSCQGCPEWEEHPDFGRVQRGCRAIAEEVCRIVMAVQRRECAGPVEVEG